LSRYNSTSILLEHLTQSRGASLLGVGIVALLQSRSANCASQVLYGFAMLAGLFAGIALLEQFTGMANPNRWLVFALLFS
jgi:hypothetical protein